MKKIVLFLFVMTMGLALFTQPVTAEPANNNLVIAAGETWGHYTPANYDYPWPRYPYNDDISARSFYTPAANLFYTSRNVSSGYFGNPPWSWMSGNYAMDFTNLLWAIEFNPTDEFADINEELFPNDPNYVKLHYNHDIPGYDDPKRNYHDPVGGGAYLSDDRTHAWSTAAWPTQVGVDVKMTVHAWTMPYGHLDDFHLVEFELTNTGQADLNADGTVDITDNKIHSLVLGYEATHFGFLINRGGGRSYYQPNSRFRSFGLDLTPDENGAPWDIPFQGYGSDVGDSGFPGLGYSRSWGSGYYDAFHGYTYLGAKKWDEATGTWVEKHLAFKNSAGEEVVPAVGEGERRGWFRTFNIGYNGIMDGTPRGNHIAATGAFYLDGGKGKDAALFDLQPNPALFQSGTEGDITTFVVKDDPSTWTYPDGAYEKAEPVMATDPITGEQVGINPLDPERGQQLEPDIITEGLITEYRFDGSGLSAFGPFSLEVGETMRAYFVRGSGFRMQGLRKTIKAARAVYESIDAQGNYNVPSGPPVPEIAVTASAAVKPVIKFADPDDLGDADGIKIYRANVWPQFNSLYDLYPMHDKWWKTNTPGQDPDPVPFNPLFRRMELINLQSGDYWGPYHLIKVIPESEYSNYVNNGADAGTYAYAWEDETYTAPGQQYYYYVSSYKEGAASTVPAPFQGLDDVTWLESGKVNINGRTGHWEGTWPWSTRHAYFPDPEDAEARKDLGAAFTLVSPTAAISDIELDRTKIGVRPNPYKRAAFHDVGQHQVMFYNLPQRATIKIFDLTGMIIDEIDFSAPVPENGTYFWDMYSKNGNEIASGLYIWVCEYDGGQQTGTFAVIR